MLKTWIKQVTALLILSPVVWCWKTVHMDKISIWCLFAPTMYTVAHVYSRLCVLYSLWNSTVLYIVLFQFDAKYNLFKYIWCIYRYELSDKAVSACHTLKAHLCDGKTLSSRELVSITDLRVWAHLSACMYICMWSRAERFREIM